jgi:hypothetical protein
MFLLSKRLNQLFPSSKLVWLLLSMSQNFTSKQMSMFLLQHPNSLPNQRLLTRRSQLSLLKS